MCLPSPACRRREPVSVRYLGPLSRRVTRRTEETGTLVHYCLSNAPCLGLPITGWDRERAGDRRPLGQSWPVIRPDISRTLMLNAIRCWWVESMSEFLTGYGWCQRAARMALLSHSWQECEEDGGGVGGKEALNNLINRTSRLGCQAQHSLGSVTCALSSFTATCTLVRVK